MKWVVVVCFLCLPFSAHGWDREAFHISSSAKFSLGLDWRYFWISGEMLVPAGGQLGSGSTVDIASDLGLDQGDGTCITLEGVIKDNHLIAGDFLMSLPSSVAKPRKTFRFHNRTYQEGIPIEAKVDVNWLRLSYGYRMGGTDSWFWAPRLGVHYVRCGAFINGETREEGITANMRALDATYPVVGIATHLFLPYGIHFSLETEGVHLLNTGFLGMASVTTRWEIHPDVTFTMSIGTRFVARSEDHQPLNNQWLLGLTGGAAGVSFGF